MGIPPIALFLSPNITNQFIYRHELSQFTHVFPHVIA